MSLGDERANACPKTNKKKMCVCVCIKFYFPTPLNPSPIPSVREQAEFQIFVCLYLVHANMLSELHFML